MENKDEIKIDNSNIENTEEFNTTDEYQEPVTDFSLMVMVYNYHNVMLTYECKTDTFNGVSKEDTLRYLKMAFTNKERFLSRFIDKFYNHANIDPLINGWDEHGLVAFLENGYDDAVPFTYAEAFSITNEAFRAKVFSAINVGEMISNLGSTRIATDGINVKHKIFDINGDLLRFEDYHNIYEVHEVMGDKLGLPNEKLYSIKCWCTSTNKEHWLWITDKYKDDPLSAIASTFFIHENLIPYLKEIKRHGDIALYELTEDIKAEGNLVPLTKEQYFGFLTAQS